MKYKTKNKKVENLLDKMVCSPYIVLKDKKDARILGKSASQLRKAGILHISSDSKTKETVAFLKNRHVKKKKNRGTEYTFCKKISRELF